MDARRRPLPPRDEVDQLLLNARLRDEIEPYLDESVRRVDVRRMTTAVENEFLASMLEWERAPALPIGHWFEPELKLPAPELLADDELHEILWQTIEKLYRKRIVLEFTDHLSDRELYCVVCRDILPSQEKKIELSKAYLRWQCLDVTDYPEIWLRYYASRAEREGWAAETGDPLPPSESPPYPRKMPRRLR